MLGRKSANQPIPLPGEELTLTFGGAFDKNISKPLTRKGIAVSAIKEWGSAKILQNKHTYIFEDQNPT